MVKQLRCNDSQVQLGVKSSSDNEKTTQSINTASKLVLYFVYCPSLCLVVFVVLMSLLFFCMFIYLGSMLSFLLWAATQPVGHEPHCHRPLGGCAFNCQNAQVESCAAKAFFLFLETERGVIESEREREREKETR